MIGVPLSPEPEVRSQREPIRSVSRRGVVPSETILPTRLSPVLERILASMASRSSFPENKIEPYVQAVLRGVKPCMIGMILATGIFMIIKNGIIINDGVLSTNPIILTVLLAAVYFGSRRLRKEGISPILLICLSAVAGIGVYGI